MSLELWISQVSFEACQVQTLGRDSHSVRRQPSFMDGLWRPGVDYLILIDICIYLYFILNFHEVTYSYGSTPGPCRAGGVRCALSCGVWCSRGAVLDGEFVWCNQCWFVLNFSVVFEKRGQQNLQLDPWQGEVQWEAEPPLYVESSSCRTLNGMGQALDLTGTTPEVPPNEAKPGQLQPVPKEEIYRYKYIYIPDCRNFMKLKDQVRKMLSSLWLQGWRCHAVFLLVPGVACFSWTDCSKNRKWQGNAEATAGRRPIFNPQMLWEWFSFCTKLRHKALLPGLKA